jgi:hypothetical protein
MSVMGGTRHCANQMVFAAEAVSLERPGLETRVPLRIAEGTSVRTHAIVSDRLQDELER